MTTGDSTGGRSRLRRRVLTDDVQESVMSLLMDGELPPGSAVNIDAIARDLGVSATPVREALAQLATTGLVDREALRGYRVAPALQVDELALLIDARLAIEPVNTHRACSRAQPSMLAELDSVLAAQEAAPTGPAYPNYRQYLDADRAFHEVINFGGGNPFLSYSFRALNGHIQRFRLFHEHRVDDAVQTLDEHRAVLTAMRAGQAEDAAEAMREHLRRVLLRATGFAEPPLQ